MSKMVSNLYSGRKERIQQITAATAATEAKEDQSVAIARQQQEQAVQTGRTDASLSRARRTPRGRRLLIGEQESTLG
ncbi:hypothetical protein [Bosea sp. (in: a-proteobacteria)]|uniref:hypothetical protein n=1 Tax=Bosea sp. (in: a-proteobacteria) TaxID=1871050 RepID=UPI002638A73C|nr:hypothetical protein [Bosea sp. (in: a-proteobacteria)]MCO5091988.1 hypothetical protein [Bosea sp. (in: a-proteobacteria)]